MKNLKQYQDRVIDLIKQGHRPLVAFRIAQREEAQRDHYGEDHPVNQPHAGDSEWREPFNHNLIR